MPLGVAALSIGFMTVLLETGAGGPGGTEPGLCLVNGTGARKADYSLFCGPGARKARAMSIAFLLCSSRIADPYYWLMRRTRTVLSAN